MTEASLGASAPAEPSVSPVTAAPARIARPVERATIRGRIAFVLGLSLVLSSFPEFRIRIAGLHAHVYLLVLGVAAIGLLFDRRRSTASLSLHGAGVALLGAVLVTNLLGGDQRDALSICIKWVTVAFTFVVCARLPQHLRDLELAAYGLIAGVTAISLRGLLLHQQDPTYYLEPLRGIGSRNTFSMWTLAPLLYCAWLTGSQRLTRKTKALILVAIVTMVIPQALSLSRSGWLLIAATFTFAFLGRRSLRSLLGGVIAGAAVYWAVSQLDFLERAESRFNDLRSGTVSDEFRISIAKAGMNVFVENPVFGVSQADIPYALARELRSDIVNSHNLYVEILAGMGLAGVIAMLAFLSVLVQTWRRAAALQDPKQSGELALVLLPLLALGALRALTTEELVYNPSFVMGVAIAFAAARLRIGEVTATRSQPQRDAMNRAVPARH